jgi:hypothetical protein
MPGLLDLQPTGRGAPKSAASSGQGVAMAMNKPTRRGLLDDLTQGQSQPTPGSVLWRLLKSQAPQQVQAAGQTLGGLLDPAKRLFGEGEFWNGPQDPQAASDMRGLLMTTGAGASALPREVGSVGAFGFGRLGGTGIANEIASLRAQLESITGNPLPPRPRPVAGTSPQQLAAA